MGMHKFNYFILDNEGYAISIFFSAICLFIINKKLILNRLNFLEAFKRQNCKINDILTISNKLTTAISWPMCFCVLIHWLCDFSIEYLALQNTSQTFGNNNKKNNFNATNNGIIIQYFNIGSQRSAQIVYTIAFIHILLFIPFLIFRTTQSNFTYFKTHWQLIVIILAMILGKKLTPIFCFIVIIYTIMNNYFHEKGFNFLIKKILLTNFIDTFSRALFKYLLGSLAFYALSHQCTLTSIPWDAAFVGLPGNFKYQIVAAILILFHLFSGNFLSISNIFFNLIWNKSTNQININLLHSEIFIFIAFNALRVSKKFNLFLI